MADVNSDEQNTQSRKPGRAIFISYRRSDTEGEAGRLYDDLVRAYSDDSVFMDVTGIQPGLDFRKAIDTNIAGCGVLLAVIGPNWATATDASGKFRLDNLNDYVRLEIASALANQIPVIPVLVHGAHMPALEQLPDDLKDLRYRNSVELTHARWNSDVTLLVSALKSYVSAVQAHPTETVHATLPVQLPPPQAPPVTPPRTNRAALYSSGIIALAILLGLGGYLTSKHAASVGTPQTVSTPTQAASDPGATPPASSTITPSVSKTDTSSMPKPTASPDSAGNSNSTFTAFLGDWKDSQDAAGDGDNLIALSIVEFAGQLVVRPRGQCPKKICNWGPKNATINGVYAVTDAWKLHNTDDETKRQRTATLSMRVVGNGLAVTVHNVWTEENGKTRQGYTSLQFVKGQS